MLCVNPHKNASKKELQLRKRLQRVKVLKDNCFKTWHIKQAFVWDREGHDLLVAIRALEIQNTQLIRDLKISKTELALYKKSTKSI